MMANAIKSEKKNLKFDYSSTISINNTDGRIKKIEYLERYR